MARVHLFNGRNKDEIHHKNKKMRFPDLEKRLTKFSDDAVQFLKSLLFIDPDQRPSAREALKNKWFKHIKHGI